MNAPLSNSDLIDKDQQHMIHPLHQNAAHAGGKVWVRAEGSHLFDADGNRYIDGLSCLWNVSCGHGRRELADAVGFRYEYLQDQDQYAHAAVIFMITPDGRISRYLYGVQFEPKTVRLGLVEASEGKIGTATDRFLLFCYHFDPAAGAYGPAAVKIMRLGGFVTLVALAFLVGIFWLRELRRKRTALKEAAT